MIELKNVSKQYTLGANIIHALDSTSLTIKDGDFVAIVGPSGSGKSTLLHLIGGLDRPDKGSVIVDGIEINHQKDTALAEYRNRTIGFVFQTFNLLPMYTALENAALPLIFSDLDRKVREKRASVVLEKIGLGKRLNHKPSELSGGESQRVAIARALINNPKMILADEPTGNLDSKTGAEIISIFKDLSKNDGITIVMVTHNQKDASAAQRKYEILDGKIRGEEK